MCLRTFRVNKEGKNMRAINIAIDCEKEHKTSIYALTTSIVVNKNKNSIYNIYIVVNGDNKDLYLDILNLKKNNIEITLIESETDIPEELGKIIYLKWNTLVTGDLSQVFDVDLEGKSFAAVSNLSQQLYAMPEDLSQYDDSVRIIDLHKEYNSEEYKEISGFYSCCYEEIVNNCNRIVDKSYILSMKDNAKLRNSALIYRLDKSISADKYFDGVLSEMWMHYYKLSPLGDEPIQRKSSIENIGDISLQRKNVIPILLKVEDNDVPYLVALIMSIVSNLSEDRLLDIRIVYRQLSKTHKDMLLSLANSNSRFTIMLYNIQLLLDNNKYGTFELLTSLIFTEYDKAMYIRKGRICKGNIADIYDVDINGYLLATYELEEETNMGATFAKMPQIELDVSLINVQEWNKREICKSVYEQMYSKGYSLSDVFGIIYRKDIKIINSYELWCVKTTNPDEYMEMAEHYISISECSERLLDELKAQEERESYNMNKLIDRINKLEKDNAKLKTENTNLSNKNKVIKGERDRFLYEIVETRKSITYKIGRVITFIPRKIRGER